MEAISSPQYYFYLTAVNLIFNIIVLIFFFMLFSRINKKVEAMQIDSKSLHGQLSQVTASISSTNETLTTHIKTTGLPSKPTKIKTPKD